MTNLPKAVATVQVDNERVRVTEWRFAPGAETGEHVHRMDYVVVPGGEYGPDSEGTPYSMRHSPARVSPFFISTSMRVQSQRG